MRKGCITFPSSGDVEDRQGWLPPPRLLQENKVTLSPAAGKAFMPQRVVLGNAWLCVVMESTATSPCPVAGHGWDLRTRKPYPRKQCVPWQHIILGRSSALVSSIRSEFQRGVASHLVGINVAVGNALSVIPSQQDKVMPNPHGILWW